MHKLVRILFWLAAAFALVMAILPQSPSVPHVSGDKLQHVMAFVCLALLGSAAYPRWPLLKYAAGLSGFGALIELIQFIPILHRDAEMLDWVADSVAASGTLLIVHLWRGSRQRLKSKFQ